MTGKVRTGLTDRFGMTITEKSVITYPANGTGGLYMVDAIVTRVHPGSGTLFVKPFRETVPSVGVVTIPAVEQVTVKLSRADRVTVIPDL